MFDHRLIEKYNQPGPRYTSYPPANFFHEQFDGQQYLRLIEASNTDEPRNVSLYVHIPFCPQICHFCGCNTSLYKNEAEVEQYIKALLTEIKLVADEIDKRRVVTQIHWGGGTPNSISYKWINTVMTFFYKYFKVDTDAEIAMECNPAYLELTDLIELSKLGFNRLSLGVQDFDTGLLKQMNRIPPKFPVKDLIRTAKKAGIDSINIDLMYGLPGQSLEHHLKSVRKTIALNPDRIVTFSYAHVPWFKSNQKNLEGYAMPEPEQKLNMLESAYNLLSEGGYVPIGMDHYVKPDDELFIALKNKKLHRNFQGYASREQTGQVYAFGATAISQLQKAYAQNVRNIDQYIQNLNDGQLPVLRGYELNAEEQIIRKVITEIMCNHQINWEQLAEELLTSVAKVKESVCFDPQKFQPFINDKMVEMNEEQVTVTPRGYFLIRNIAMAFDPYLNQEEKKYSKTI